MIVTDFFQALQAGKELANAETWKNAQLVVSKLTVLASAGIGVAALLGHPLPISYEQSTALIAAVGVIVGLLNGTATVVSTTRIGLRPRRNDVPPGGDDGSGDSISSGNDGPDASNDDPLPYLNHMDGRG